MKQIVLQDDDFRKLIDSLKLVRFEQADHVDGPTAETARLIHRAFHYEVTLWAQKHGADITGVR